MKNFITTACMAVLLSAAGTAVAQENHWTAEGGYIDAAVKNGGEFAVGYRFAKSGFRLTPMVGVLMYSEDNGRYDKQTQSNGAEVCRDSTNGHYADKELCDNTRFKAVAKLEASYRFSGKYELGIGGRHDKLNGTSSYATAGMRLSDNLDLKAAAGKDYTFIGISFRR